MPDAIHGDVWRMDARPNADSRPLLQCASRHLSGSHHASPLLPGVVSCIIEMDASAAADVDVRHVGLAGDLHLQSLQGGICLAQHGLEQILRL